MTDLVLCALPSLSAPLLPQQSLPVWPPLSGTPVNTKTRVLLQSSSLLPLGKSPWQEGRGYQIRAAAPSSCSQNSDLTLILPGLTRQVKLSLNFATARNSFHFLPRDAETPERCVWKGLGESRKISDDW